MTVYYEPKPGQECTGCRKPLENDILNDNGDYYHSDCLKVISSTQFVYEMNPHLRACIKAGEESVILVAVIMLIRKVAEGHFHLLSIETGCCLFIGAVIGYMKWEKTAMM